MTTEGMKQRSFWFPEELLKRLKIVAAVEGKTQNEIVVGMVQAYVEKREAA